VDFNDASCIYKRVNDFSNFNTIGAILLEFKGIVDILIINSGKKDYKNIIFFFSLPDR